MGEGTKVKITSQKGRATALLSRLILIREYEAANSRRLRDSISIRD